MTGRAAAYRVPAGMSRYEQPTERVEALVFGIQSAMNTTPSAFVTPVERAAYWTGVADVARMIAAGLGSPELERAFLRKVNVERSGTYV